MIPIAPTSIRNHLNISKKRGPMPKVKVNIKWSANFAYAIGLIVSDGNLSRDGRHISFASKDLEQIQNYLKALGIKIFIGTVNTGLENQTYRVQFSDVYFWNFLSSIGIHPSKSRSIGVIAVPKGFLPDFIRGVFDGDGSFYSYRDKRWRSSFMFYLSIASASKLFIDWIRIEIEEILNIKGHLSAPSLLGTTWQLKYAKAESSLLISKMYEKRDCISLSRKRLKIEEILGTIPTTDSIGV